WSPTPRIRSNLPFECEAEDHRPHSLSNPWLVNLSVRLFSVTVRATLSGTPAGISASISSVTRTEDPMSPTRSVMTSSVILLASRPARAGSSVTVPCKRWGLDGVAGPGAGTAGGVGTGPGGVTVPVFPSTGWGDEVSALI